MPENIANVTVSIATHNRCEDLLRTCRAVLNLDPAPREIIVCADGCTDETEAELRRNFPEVNLMANSSPAGSIVSRDRILRRAEAPIILSLDDDSYPVEPDFLARVEEWFAADPKLAVLTCFQMNDEFPLTVRDPDSQRGTRRLVASFPNSAAAIRRDVYFDTAGYPATFFHQYEEPDFALQCYALGYHVVYEPALTVRHHYSGTGRNETRIHHLHARNEFWSTTMRAPLLLVPPVALYRVLSQLRYAASRGIGWLVKEPLWWIGAIRGLPRCARERRGVPLGKYLRWLRLFRQPTSYQPQPE